MKETDGMIEEMIEGEILDSLRRVLRTKPFVGGSHYLGENQTLTQRLTLIFADSSEHILGVEGSVYDYNILGRERYHCDPTVVQIQRCIAEKGAKPKALRYHYDNKKDSSRSLGPVVVSYETIESLIKEEGIN